VSSTRIPALGPRGEGWVALQVVLLIVIGFAGGLGPHLPIADSDAVGPLRVLGYGLVIGGLLLVVWSVTLLRRARAMTVMPRPVFGGALVESGPYRWIRHPVYAGLVIAEVGATLLWLAWLALIATIALAVVLDLKRRREEAWLLDRYPGYAAYRSRTKALVPLVY
jgi:protein-S-isoprenylcysteine O-methyltransferase Ste14